MLYRIIHKNNEIISICQGRGTILPTTQVINENKQIQNIVEEGIEILETEEDLTTDVKSVNIVDGVLNIERFTEEEKTKQKKRPLESRLVNLQIKINTANSLGFTDLKNDLQQRYTKTKNFFYHKGHGRYK